MSNRRKLTVYTSDLTFRMSDKRNYPRHTIQRFEKPARPNTDKTNSKIHSKVVLELLILKKPANLNFLRETLQN